MLTVSRVISATHPSAAAHPSATPREPVLSKGLGQLGQTWAEPCVTLSFIRGGEGRGRRRTGERKGGGGEGKGREGEGGRSGGEGGGRGGGRGVLFEGSSEDL